MATRKSTRTRSTTTAQSVNHPFHLAMIFMLLVVGGLAITIEPIGFLCLVAALIWSVAWGTMTLNASPNKTGSLIPGHSRTKATS